MGLNSRERDGEEKSDPETSSLRNMHEACGNSDEILLG